MALASGTGFVVAAVDGHGELFSEAPSRVVVCVDAGRVDGVVRRAEAARVPVLDLGRAGGERLVVEGLVDLDLAVATRAWHVRLPSALDPASVGSTP
jgi:phosphoribosylformylglycinamidine synthase subunit PurL